MKESLTQLGHNFVEAAKIAFKKLPSRKLLVFAIATHMTYIAILEPALWFTIATIFMGIQGVLDYRSANASISRIPGEANSSNS